MPQKYPASQEKDPIKQQPEVEIASEEHKPEEVEVNLDPQPKETPAPDPTEKLRNQMFYEMRQQEKKILAAQKQMMEEMIQRMSGSNAQPQKGSERLDDFDEEVERVAQTDWRKAVDMRAERIADRKLEEKMKAKEEERKAEESRQHALRVEAKGRDKVLNEFPDAADESSTTFKTYMEIYNRELADDPMFVYNPRKHELILPELREKMKGRAEDTNPEIERLKRVAAGAATPTRPNQSSNKIMLTQDEIEMCKRSGIPIETYARTKKLGATGFKEGVTINE